jgi:hypothetical protein
MRKMFLATAILLLASSLALAQGSTPPAANDGSQYPGTGAPSAQQPDQSQKPTSDKSDDKDSQTLDGCLSGAADTFVLTDASGRTYELFGETSELKANVGHQVRLWGMKAGTGGGEKSSASGQKMTFGVKKVQSLSDTCK